MGVRETENEERTVETLRELQEMNLASKIIHTRSRIREYYEKLDGKVYISFSGGKDSTVLLHIAREMYPEIPAVFVNTGLEYPEIREHVRTFENVEWLKPEKSFKEVILSEGYPIASKKISKFINAYRRGIPYAIKFMNGEAYDSQGRKSRFCIAKRWRCLADAPFMVSNKCCDIMKKAPIKKYAKETKRSPIIGTMAGESEQRLQAWLSTGCNSFDSEKEMSKPLSIWTEQDILQYIVDNDIKIASVYGDIVNDESGNLKTTGLERTGCMFCGFGAHIEKSPNRFERMKETHPKQWEFCMKSVEDGGLGMKAVLDYCNIPTGYEEFEQLKMW